MKSRHVLIALAFSAASLANLRVLALPSKPVVTTPEENAAKLRVKLDRAAKNVRDRLHMSTMLEVTDDAGIEQNMAYLHKSGWIIKATVEDVEAARKAAAATPSLDDDKMAEELAHRASCRFFYSE